MFAQIRLCTLHFHTLEVDTDPVVENIINAQDNDQPMQFNPSFQKEGAKGCGCGRGASSNKSHPGG